MRMKHRTLFVIYIVCLSTLIMGWNFGSDASTQENRSNTALNTCSYPRGTEDYYWGPIEVISEPIKGNDFNNLQSFHPQVIVKDGKIYTVWNDLTNLNNSGSDSDIFYRYFNGSQWSEIQIISEPVIDSNTNNGDSLNPDIAVVNDKIYVVWEDHTDWYGAGGEKDIFYRYFNGIQWSEIQIISEPVVGNNLNTRRSEEARVEVENDNIYVVWSDKNNTNGAGLDYDIFYRCNLTGYNWEDVQIISEPRVGNDINTQLSQAPAITVENGNIYVVWDDENNTNGAGVDSDIFYRCNLTGYNWEDVQIISEPVIGSPINTQPSNQPNIAAENGNIFVVWEDQNDTNGAGVDSDIFYRCNLSGSGWGGFQVISEPVPGINKNTANSWNPDIALENGRIYVAWHDLNNTNNAGNDQDIFYKCNLTGTGWEPVQVISEPIKGSNQNIGESGRPAIAAYLGKSYVIWEDTNNTDGSGVDEDIHFRSIKFLPPVLSQGSVTPTFGNTSTWFNYTVTYADMDNDTPLYVKLCIDGINCTMIEVDKDDNIYLDGKFYYYNITHLGIGVHTYQFWTADDSYTRFTLLKSSPRVYNTPPNIITDDNLTAIEDIYYEVSYEYEDIDIANVGQIGFWNFSSNASWLAFDNTLAILNGTPLNEDVGEYWVNISINDTMDINFSNFTLTVLNINDNPIINTTNIVTTYEDELYEVDYNATDIDSPIANQVWSLATNATAWLDIDTATGIISGTPTNDEVGEYWVNISVNDSENGEVFTNFTLIVLNVNDPPLIKTEDVLTANESELYLVDYNATDIDPTNDVLTWTLNTNATWLNINSDTGILSGTPTINDLGWYTVNVSVDDNCGGLDWHEFILTVIKENLSPYITTEDDLSATIDEIYEVDYDATDVDTPLDKLRWSLTTNASWLDIDMISGMLTGTPALEDLGKYWVNVTVTDEVGAFDFHNFTLTVYLTPNLPPNIITEDILYAVVGQEYSIDYEAEDDRTPVDKLRWFLKSNASWLNTNENTGLLFGTPEVEHIGSYLINISVFDGENGWDWHVFILQVTQEPVDENNVPISSEPGMTPTEGDTETEFTFSVHYYDADNDAPAFVQVVIDNKSHNMTLRSGDPSNGTYEYKIKLSEGTHTYYFTASDGIDSVSTDIYITTDISEVRDDKDDETAWDWLIWVVIIAIIIIIVLVLLLIFMRKKKAEEKTAVEEEEPPSEAPPEQPPTPDVPQEPIPTPEAPTHEQTQVPEVPPEQTPTPEVTPQVPQPEVEPELTTPAPVPQVEEPQVPTPQVEQVQVEPQEPVVEQPAEPQQQPPTPTIKTEPTIEENDA